MLGLGVLLNISFLQLPTNELSSPVEQKTKFIVLGLIKNDNDEYLVSVRFDPKVPEAHMKYDFVGGTNEFGESLEGTLVREVKEETGLNVEVQSMLPWTTSRVWNHDDYLMHTVVFCYLCKFVSGELAANDPKIESLRWVKFDDNKVDGFLPTTQYFLEKIKEVGLDNI